MAKIEVRMEFESVEECKKFFDNASVVEIPSDEGLAGKKFVEEVLYGTPRSRQVKKFAKAFMGKSIMGKNKRKGWFNTATSKVGWKNRSLYRANLGTSLHKYIKAILTTNRKADAAYLASQVRMYIPPNEVSDLSIAASVANVLRAKRDCRLLLKRNSEKQEVSLREGD